MHDAMPYYGESVLYDEFDNFMRTGSSFAYDFPGCATVIPTLMCPSDPANPKFITFTYSTLGVVGPPGSLDGKGATQGFHGNYVVCASSKYYNPGPATMGNPPYLNSANLTGYFSRCQK